MKKGLFTCLVLLLPALATAIEWTSEERRETVARIFRRDASLTWTYESVMPKGAKNYAYLSQGYNLNLYGPLIFPALGKSKLSLTYRLGKNIVTPNWWTLRGNLSQRVFDYSVSTIFSPPYINRLLSFWFDFGKSTLYTNSLSSPERTLDHQSLSAYLAPPWRIPLPRLGKKSNNNRRNQDSTFLLPSVYSVYRKSDSQSSNYEQQNISQYNLVRWSIGLLNLQYSQTANRDFDLRVKKTLTRDEVNRYLNANMFFSQPFWGMRSISLNGDYNQYQSLYPQRQISQQMATGMIANTNAARFLRFSHSLTYSNRTNWDPVRKVPGATSHTLSLLSDYSTPPGSYLRNCVTYNRDIRQEGVVPQSISETINAGRGLMRGLSLSGTLTQRYSWNRFKTGITEATGRIDLSPFSFLGSYLSVTYSQQKDLLAGRVGARGLSGIAYLGGSLSPLGYLLNNNRNGNGNHNGNGNYYNNLLSLSYSYQVQLSRDLLGRQTTIDTLQSYGVKSSPFNDYLTIDILYRRQGKRIDGKFGYSDYLAINIYSGTSLRYKGLTVNVSVFSQNLQRPNVLVSVDYGARTGGFSFGYRVLGVGTPTPIRILSLSYTRRF